MAKGQDHRSELAVWEAYVERWRGQPGGVRAMQVFEPGPEFGRRLGPAEAAELSAKQFDVSFWRALDSLEERLRIAFEGIRVEKPLKGGTRDYLEAINDFLRAIAIFRVDVAP